jgi:phosphatidylserine decarboxylase
MPKKNNNESKFSEKLLGWLFTALPHHLISRVVYFLTRIKTPLATPVIRWFIKTFKVDMSDAEIQIIEEYACFNDFFIRSLTPDARPITSAENSVASPVDGTVSQCGDIVKGHLFQAKGHFYSVEDLLGGDTLMSHMFEGGKFATIYLAPYNYHRIHMPMDGMLKKMIHVPGRLFSVAPWTVRQIPRLFARNERVVCLFSTATGPIAMILVGAINVAAIETIWHGLVTPSKGRKVSEFDYNHAERKFSKGQEMGRFNMGSTVILLTTDKVQLEDLKPQQTLRMGELIGHTY